LYIALFCEYTSHIATVFPDYVYYMPLSQFMMLLYMYRTIALQDIHIPYVSNILKYRQVSINISCECICI